VNPIDWPTGIIRGAYETECLEIQFPDESSTTRTGLSSPISHQDIPATARPAVGLPSMNRLKRASGYFKPSMGDRLPMRG
jgi:hypothetical protein